MLRPLRRPLTAAVIGLVLMGVVPGGLPVLADVPDDGIHPPELVLVDPEPAAPKLEEDQREPVPAWEPEGPLDPPVWTPDLSGSPEDVLARLEATSPDPAQNGAVYEVNGAEHLAQLYAQPINYLTGAGEWQPISTDLVPNGEGGLVNEANAFTTSFPAELSELSPAQVVHGEGSYSFHPLNVDGAKTLEKVAEDAVSYALDAETVLTYRATALGLEELVTLSEGPVGAFAFTVQITTNDLTLRQEPSGGILVLDRTGATVSVMPPPYAYDSSSDPSTGEPAFGDATSVLADLGKGTYTLTTTVDPLFLAGATYPVTIDPGDQQVTPDRDGWVNSGDPTGAYESSTELRAGNYSTTTRYGFLQFYLNHDDLQPRAHRIVDAAQLDLYATTVVNSNVATNVKRVNQAWPATGTLNWNNQPSVAESEGVYDSDTGPPGSWYVFNLKDLYQKVMDSTHGIENNGLRIGGASATPATDNYKLFASAEYGDPTGRPRLFLYYNDRPDKPTLNSPANLADITYSSPTLKIEHPVSDRNGDPVMVNYQLSLNESFSSIEASSGWIDDADNWTVPAGVLKDGSTYHWRVQAWDVCDPGDLGMCPGQGPGNYVNFQVSNTRSFDVALDHFGSDERWQMWTDALGNGMNLEVNEATGNLHLFFSLDSIPTPAGTLDLALAYNHQDAEDSGLGAGWVVSAGPGSNPRDLPTTLKTVQDGDAVRITTRDGDKLFFSKIDNGSSNFYTGSGAGAGTVKKNKDDTWLYTTTSGSVYTFDADKHLSSATPVTNTDSGTSFTYSFDTNGRILSVTDVLNKTITFDWAAATGELLIINRWDGKQWKITKDGTTARVKTVQDPTGAVVSIGYDGTGRVGSVADGTSRQASLDYTTQPQGVPYSQVSWVQHPGATSVDRTTFTYEGPYTGQVATRTTVADPRADDDPGNPDHRPRFETKVSFNTQGLPIVVEGPASFSTGVRPTTHMVWDSNGNLKCTRSPAAVAKDSSKCTAGASGSDPLNTDYRYDNKVPYRLESVTGPASNPDGTGTRAVTTYAYDEGFAGLYVEKYDNDKLSGVPTHRELHSTVNQDWGTGHPGQLTGDDTFSLRWTGYLNISTKKTYKFRLWSDDGSTLVIGRHVLADCFGDAQDPWRKNCGNGDVSKELWTGRYPITVQYQEKTGSARVKLEWDQGSGTWEVIPSSVLTPNLGDLTTKTAPLGLDTVYAYTNDDYKTRRLPRTLTRTDDVTSRVTTYTYDAYGRVDLQQDPAGTIHNVYGTGAAPQDARCLVTVKDRTQAETHKTCNATGDVTRVTKVVRPVGLQGSQDRVTDTTYDEVGRLLTATTSDGTHTRTVTNDYDDAGRLLTVEDRVTQGQTTVATRLTSYQYDAAGRLWKEILPDPDGGGPLASPQVIHAYDAVGNETRTTDARGKLWDKQYDGQNRVVRAEDPYDSATVTAYDDTGTGGMLGNAVTTVTDPAGVATEITFDVVGRKASERIGNPGQQPPTWLAPTRYEYDAAGNPTKVTDPTDKYVETSYTAYGETQSVKTLWDNPSGPVEQVTATNAYDTAGRVDTVTDPQGQVTDYGYDAEGRLTSVDPPGPTTAWAYLYSDAGELVRVTTPDNKVRDFTFDVLGRPASSQEIRQGGTTVTLTNGYDGFSQLASVSIPAYGGIPAVTRRFEYDALGRRTRRYAQAAGSTVGDETFAYDAAGNMTRASNSGADVYMTYDDAGRPHQVGPTQSTATTTYGYTSGRLTSREDAAGTTSFHYDPYGRIDDLTLPLGAHVMYAYNAAGQPLTRSDPSGLTTTRAYDGAGQLWTETVGSVASFEYTYDKNGNVDSLDQAMPANSESGVWDYGYDDQDRLTSAVLTKDAGGTATLGYGYDASGNRTTVTTDGSTVTTAYDDAGLPVSSSDGTTYTHDALGSLRSITGGPRTWTYTYDAWSRMTQAAGSGGSPTITYAYDALDRAVSRTKSGITTTSTFIGITEDVAKAVTGGTTAYYAHSLSGPVAERVGTTNRIYMPNLHGDTALIANTSGGVTATTAYGPFGDKRATTGTDTSPFSFQSQTTDPDTGLVDMLTRLYDPALGRFITRDVVFGETDWPVTLNQFVYGGANPVTMDDPTGMCMYDCFGTVYDGDASRGNGGRRVPSNQNYTYLSRSDWSDETDWRATGMGVPPKPPAPPPPMPFMLATTLALANQIAVINTDRVWDQAQFHDLRAAARAGEESVWAAGAAAYRPGDYKRLTPGQRANVLQGKLCAYCGGQATEVDHIMPKAIDYAIRGESEDYHTRSARVNRPENLAAACRTCNASKAARLIGYGPGRWLPKSPSAAFQETYGVGYYMGLLKALYGGGHGYYGK